MRRFVKTSMLVSMVLLAGTVCLGQDRSSAASNSSEMWEAYKKMWEGKWEVTLRTGDGGEGRGEKIVEVILDGRAVWISDTWSSQLGSVQQRTLGSWCPKQQAIVLHRVGGGGGRTMSVVKLVDGKVHSSNSHIAVDGTENSSRVVAAVIDEDTNQVTVVEGLYAGTDLTWKRKK
jgi:hypothetical protein